MLIVHSEHFLFLLQSVDLLQQSVTNVLFFLLSSGLLQIAEQTHIELWHEHQGHSIHIDKPYDCSTLLTSRIPVCSIG